MNPPEDRTVSDILRGPDTSGGRTYFPPCSLVLQGLGIELSDLARNRVTVDSSFLKRLISILAEQCDFDRDWYLERYLDVQAAILAGDLRDPRQHFLEAGYFENRLPSEIPFDAGWYYDYYKDLQAAFRPEDVGGLRDHFLSCGYFEGRAGTPDTLSAVDAWLAAVR